MVSSIQYWLLSEKFPVYPLLNNHSCIHVHCSFCFSELKIYYFCLSLKKEERKEKKKNIFSVGLSKACGDGHEGRKPGNTNVFVRVAWVSCVCFHTLRSFMMDTYEQLNSRHSKDIFTSSLGLHPDRYSA